MALLPSSACYRPDDCFRRTCMAFGHDACTTSVSSAKLMMRCTTNALIMRTRSFEIVARDAESNAWRLRVLSRSRLRYRMTDYAVGISRWVLILTRAEWLKKTLLYNTVTSEGHPRHGHDMHIPCTFKKWICQSPISVTSHLGVGD